MQSVRSLLEHSDAVRQLQQGCIRIGLHPEAALELVCFLHLRRLFVPQPGSGEPYSLSPGGQLDRLWHWMLLNTKVARAVYALVGGEVEHASTDEEDLSDDTKVVRRLAALNLMAATGCTLHLAFWEEPGTQLQELQRTTHHQAGQQLQLYVPPGADDTLRNTLATLVFGARQRLPPAQAAPNQLGAAGGVPYLQGPLQGLAAQQQQLTSQAMPLARTFLQPPTVVYVQFHRAYGQVRPVRLCSERVMLAWGPRSTVGDLAYTAAWYLHLVPRGPIPKLTPAEEHSLLLLDAARLRLLHRGDPLANWSSTLLGAGVAPGDAVHILQPGAKLPPPINITAKCGIGLRVYRLQVHRWMLIREVKQAVEAASRDPTSTACVSAWAQMMMVGDVMAGTSREAQDNMYVDQCGIQEGSEVRVHTNLRGC